MRDENTKLKKMVIDLSLDKEMLKAVIAKNDGARRRAGEQRPVLPTVWGLLGAPSLNMMVPVILPEIAGVQDRPNVQLPPGRPLDSVTRSSSGKA